MAKLTMKNSKAALKVATPVGRLLWINLAQPKPDDAPIQAGKYTCTVAWDKNNLSEANKQAMKELIHAVEAVGREAYGDPNLTIRDLPQSVLKDGASLENQPYLHDMWVCSSSTVAKFPPAVYGAVTSRGVLSQSEIENIGQGDYGRMVINVAAYKTAATHGITCYLSLVQFAKKGAYLGGGNPATRYISDLEVDMDDVADGATVLAAPGATVLGEAKVEKDPDNFFEF